MHIGCIMREEFPAKVTPDTCSFGHLFSSGESPPPYMGQLYSHSYPNWLDCIDSALWRNGWMFILINGQEVNIASAKCVWRQKVKNTCHRNLFVYWVTVWLPLPPMSTPITADSLSFIFQPFCSAIFPRTCCKPTLQTFPLTAAT